jgi:hypothetical protein
VIYVEPGLNGPLQQISDAEKEGLMKLYPIPFSCLHEHGLEIGLVTSAGPA